MSGWKMMTNFALFQVGWFTCVYSAAVDAPLLGTFAAVLVVMVHLAIMPNPSREFLLILIAGLVGGVWESLVVINEWFVYSTGMLSSWMAPHWIIAMWLMFATTLNASLGWMKRSFWLAVVCGAAFAPLAYYAGYRLGAVSLPEVMTALLAQAAGWAVLLPLLTLLAGRLNRRPEPVPSFNRLEAGEHDV